MGIEIEDDYNLRGLGRAKAPGGPVFAPVVQAGATFATGGVPTPALPPQMQTAVNTAINTAQSIPAQVVAGFSIQLPAIPGVAGAQLFKVSGRTIPGTDDLMREIGRDLPPVARKIVNEGVQKASQMAWKLAGPPLKKFAEQALGGGVMAGVSATLGAAGSMIPGIGNVIGLAIAGLTAAIKALAKLFTGPEQCEFDPKCPDIGKEIENLTSIEALPVLITAYVETSKRLAEKAYSDKCYLAPKQGKGGKTYKCLLYIEKAFFELSEIAKNTVNVLGAEQLGRLIPIYLRVIETTGTQGWTNNENFSGAPRVLRTGVNIGERAGKIRDWTTKEAVAAEAAYIRREQGAKPPKNVDAFSFREMTARMIARHAMLLEMEARITRLSSAPVAPNEQTPFGVGEELRVAAEQCVLNPNPETKSWLRRVAMMQIMVDARVREISYARQEENRRSGRGAAVQATPANIQLLQWQCDEAQGRGPKCDELRALRSGGVPGPAPAAPRQPAPTTQPRPQAPTTPQGQGRLFQLAQARNKYVTDFLKNQALQKNQAARNLMLAVSQQPNITMGNLNEKTYAYLDAAAKSGNQAAGMILFSALKEFQDKLKAA